MSAIRRWSRTTPGFDCERGPCPSKDCPGHGDPRRPGGGHGVHGEEWAYGVAAPDGLVGISLTVFTDIFPSTVPESVRWDRDRSLAERRHAVDLTEHVGFPTDKATLRTMPAGWTPANGEQANCHLVRSSMCDTSRTGATRADIFFRRHGDPQQFAQCEAFWRAMEAWLVEQEPEIRAARVDGNYHRCNACDGIGVVANGAGVLR